MPTNPNQNERPELTAPAKWTNDCQGKKNYDGELLSISTRYWPRGGGMSILRPGAREFETNADQTIKPSARAGILLKYGDPEDEGYVTLVEVSFAADTEAEVKQLVEAWVQRRFMEARDALLKLWTVDSNG